MVEGFDALVGQPGSHGQHCSGGLEATVISDERDFDRHSLRGTVPVATGRDKCEEDCPSLRLLKAGHQHTVGDTHEYLPRDTCPLF